MKRSLLLMVSLVLALVAGAEAYPYLSFRHADGSASSFGVESLSMTANSEVTLKDGDTVLATFTVPGNYTTSGQGGGWHSAALADHKHRTIAHIVTLREWGNEQVRLAHFN